MAARTVHFRYNPNLTGTAAGRRQADKISG